MWLRKLTLGIIDVDLQPRHWCTIGLLLLLNTVANTSSLNADTTDSTHYRNEKLKFELSYPSPLQAVDSKNSLSPLLLRTNGSEYPTFNIIVEPQVIGPSDRDLEIQAERVLSEYRQVGMTDAKLLDRRAYPLRGATAFRFTIHYSSEGQPFASVITLLPTRTFLYTLTFIDRQGNFEKSEPLLNSLLDSFITTDELLPPVAKRSFAWVFYFAALLGLIFFMARAFLKRLR